jgi:hypothetical protein
MPQGSRECEVFLSCNLSVVILHPLDREIASESPEMGTIWVARFIRQGMVLAMCQEITLLSEAERICPKKEPGPSNVSEIERVVTAVPVVPQSIVCRYQEHRRQYEE